MHRDILIVDDHEAVRRGLRSLLSLRPDWNICGEAADGREGIEKARTLRPAIVLMDISLPGMDGLEATRIIHQERPGCKVVIVSQNDSAIAYLQAKEVNAEAYITKADLGSTLISTLEEVFQGQTSAVDGDTNTLSPPNRPRVPDALKLDSSQPKEGQPALAESEKLLRLATEAAELGIWQWYPQDDRVRWENERPYQIFGRSRALGPIGASEFREKICHPEDLPSLQKAFAETMQNGARFFSQARVFREDGAFVWVEFTGQLERAADGTPLRLLGTVQDITERKSAEQAVQQSEERLRLAQKVGRAGTWESDIRRGHITTSPELQELFGLPPQPANGHPELWRRMIHAEDLARVDEALNRAIAEKTEFRAEFRVTRPDGMERWVETTAQLFYDDDGKLVRIIGVSTDITGRKHIESQARQMAAEAVAATAKFRAVFEQTTVFAGIMTLDGIVIDANRLCLDACGYRAEDVLGKPLWQCGWWSRVQESRDKIKAATPLAAQGVPYREILSYSWADDSEHLVDFALYPIRDNEGRILFLHPTGVDITDLKQAEAKYRTLAETLDTEVRVRTAEVVQQSEQLRDLSSRLLQAQDEERRRIARELHDSAGQLLTALSLTIAQAAQSAPAEPIGLAKHMEESQQLVQQLSQEIRTMSYLLHPPLLDEMGLLEAIRWYKQGLAERSGLDITLEVPTEFERLSREMELVMFRLVQECLTNIHRHSGSKTAVIRVSGDGNGVMLVVQDSGKGISPEKLREVHSQGSGVGIRGMRERARHFGGHMLIESNHKGTKISFNFPLKNSSSKHEDITPQNPLQPVPVAG